MDTKKLEKFAQAARRQLLEQVEAKLERVLRTDSAELRAKAKAIKELQEQINQSSPEAVVDKVAYTWFNRFIALRYMDVNHYTRMGTVSPVPGHTQPEILQEVKQGHIDEDLPVNRQLVFDLMYGRTPSTDPQQEAYRLLLVGVCNHYHDIMPFMFERIDDYTELLMPDDLLSSTSILSDVRDTLTSENCRDIEVIGWLYQYYISEQHKEVLEGLKKNRKISPDKIPAATQLFTPHWIVRFLVENSLGRLWQLNRPNSRLSEQMEFYIKPEEVEADFLSVETAEELKICDPAVGSGHMLTYAFDLLYTIYEEEGYNAVDIPRLILEKNLYGIEIDERAGALAAFALMMKAREKDSRFLRRDVRPNICIMLPIHISTEEISQEQSISETDRDLFDDLLNDLQLFEDADNFGSLLRPHLTFDELVEKKNRLKHHLLTATDLFSYDRHQRALQAFQQAEYLARQYTIVVTNPPYMGKGMNSQLKKFLKAEFPDAKSDLFAAFILRCLQLAQKNGQLGLVTPFVWMFLSSYERLRKRLLDSTTITSLVQLEYNAFEPATIPVCAFTLENSSRPLHRGGYVRLSDFKGAANQALRTLEAINNPECGWFHRASATDFEKIPGSPISYWVSQKVKEIFDTSTPIGELADIRAGMATGNNSRHVRLWHEVGKNKLKLDAESAEDVWANSNTKWVLFNKGGEFRKWYGNNNHVLNYDRKSYEILKSSGNRCPSEQYYFRECLTWSDVTTGDFFIRYFPKGSVFSTVGNSIFESNHQLFKLCTILASNTVSGWLRIINPTLHANPGDVARIPVNNEAMEAATSRIFHEAVTIAQEDWDSYENSWGFSRLPLLSYRSREENLAASYALLRAHWAKITTNLQQIEEENNGLFVEAYGLQNELEPSTPLKQITLTCNPQFRYRGQKKVNSVLAEEQLLADTIREFISYGVGCMLGRYSLDKPGLILANQGETLDDYLLQAPNPTFTPDEDNVIPILAGDWFTDDIVGRFNRFLKITFGEEHYEENLAFIEDSLGRDIRSYFLREFYSHHVKMYKKRLIYWLFSSPKGSFNCLIYMHRYRSDTVSIVLNGYLREFQGKLKARRAHLEQVSISTSASSRDKTKALKEVDKINKVVAELKEYEDEILYPLATQQIQIDLDDGVKVNYNKFSKALKRVPGLSQ